MALPTEKQVQAKIKQWAPMMRIADWNIEFEYLGDEEGIFHGNDNVAYCTRARMLKYALIRFNRDHRDLRDDWEQVLAHEMYHIVTDDYKYNVGLMRDFTPQKQGQLLDEHINIYYERMVDDLAKGFIAALRAK